MNRITQHVPRFVDTREPPIQVEFTTTDSLLSVDFVKAWRDAPNFSHFCVHRKHLMVVLDDGYQWWVVGYLQHTDNVNLPTWEGAKNKPS